MCRQIERLCIQKKKNKLASLRLSVLYFLDCVFTQPTPKGLNMQYAHTVCICLYVCHTLKVCHEQLGHGKVNMGQLVSDTVNEASEIKVLPV